MMKNDNPDLRMIHNHSLRTLLGGLGIALPVILPIGACLLGEVNKMQESISHYYYTNMGDVFVGVLWGFGLFLITYKGYHPQQNEGRLTDNIITSTAGFLAIGVTLFPANSDYHCHLCNPKWIGWIHLGCAASFFMILGLMSLFKFTKGKGPKKEWENSKIRRNNVYIVCGIIIIAGLVVLGIYFMWFIPEWPPTVVFWIEAVMLWAFGISWLTKGRALNRIGL